MFVFILTSRLWMTCDKRDLQIVNTTRSGIVIGSPLCVCLFLCYHASKAFLGIWCTCTRPNFLFWITNWLVVFFSCFGPCDEYEVPVPAFDKTWKTRPHPRTQSKWVFPIKVGADLGGYPWVRVYLPCLIWTS